MTASNPVLANQAQKLLDQAYDLRIRDLKMSKQLASEALQISQQLKDPDLIGKSLSHLSLFQMILGEFDQAINTAEDAIRSFEKQGNERGIADAKYSIAGAQYKTDNFHKGLMTLMDCLTIYRRFDDFHNQARVFKSMGTIYEYFGDTKKAIESYEEAIEAAKKIGETDLQSNAYNPLSGIYLDHGDVDKARELINLSVAMKEQSGDIRGLAFALYGRGKVFAHIGQVKEAEADYLRSIEIHSQMGEKLGLAMANRKFGSLYKKIGNFEKAKEQLLLAYQFSQENNIILIKFKACYELYEIAKQEGKTEEAIGFLESYIRDKESVINIKALKIIESYDAIVTMENLEHEAKIQREKSAIIEQKNQDLDSFFYRISHDLKGPITSLIGLDYRMREEIADEKILGYLDEYKTQVMRINHILDDLIKITKLDHDFHEAQPIHFEAMVKDCIEMFHYFPLFAKTTFKIDIQPNISYSGEWSLINTILQNLIENAIKYSAQDRPPVIQIKIQKSDRLYIEVSDNGIGMTPEIQSKMFQMFFQGNPALKGTGLGLYILKRAIEKINGEIKVNSQPDKGSTFKISLPLN